MLRNFENSFVTSSQTAKCIIVFGKRGGGYDRNITDPETLQRMIEYIHLNPVRRGLVEEATDWIWSSARFYAGLDNVMIEMDELPVLDGYEKGC